MRLIHKPKEWVGAGIGWLWGLPDWSAKKAHPFHAPSIAHDAAHDAADLFLCGYWPEGDANEHDSYQILVWVKYRRLLQLHKKHKRCMTNKQIVKIFIRREDELFFESCEELSRNTFHMCQLRIYIPIVRLYTEIKY